MMTISRTYNLFITLRALHPWYYFVWAEYYPDIILCMFVASYLASENFTFMILTCQFPISLLHGNLLPAVAMPLQYDSSQCMWSMTACCFTTTKGSWMITSFCWHLQMTLQEKFMPFMSTVLRRQTQLCYCSGLCGNYWHGIFHRGAWICL